MEVEKILEQVLSNASSNDPQVRNGAEQTLKQMEEQNNPLLLQGLSAFLINQARTPSSRTLAAIILKNSISAKDSLRKRIIIERWIKTDDVTKNMVKTAALQSLADASRDVRSAASQVVAKVALIEIPLGAWIDLFEKILLPNLTNPGISDDIKQSSLETIGHICEEIDPSILASKADQILTAVVQGMRDNNNAVKYTACSALLSALEFCKKNFETPNERDFIMKVVLNVINLPEEKLRVIGFEILVKIASLYYDYLSAYMNTLFQRTLETIQKDTDPVAQQAVEFWSTLCEEEILIHEETEEANEYGMQPPRLCYNYVKSALNFLVPVLMEALTKQEEDPDPDDWNVAMAAGTCLSLIANTVEDEIVGYVLPFVDKHFTNPEWRYREAAILAFGSILEGPRKSIRSLIEKAVPDLLNRHLKDSNEAVKDTAAWTLGRIARLHFDAITDLSLFLTGVVNSMGDSPRVAAHCCCAVYNLCISVPDSKKSTFVPTFESMASNLLKVADRSDADENNLRTSAYEALNALIGIVPDQLPVFDTLLNFILQRLNSTFQMQILNADDQATQITLQGLLCSVLYTISLKLGSKIKQHADNLMGTFLILFKNQRQGSVIEEALMAVGAIAQGTEVDFDKYMPYFVDFLCAGLVNCDDYQVCSVSISIVGDVCRALSLKIAPYCDKIVTILLENLQRGDINRAIKPAIFSCISDIALALGRDFERYFGIVMKILGQASATAVNTKLEDEEDYDLVEHMNKLREGILEAYTGILQGMKGFKPELFVPHLNELLSLVINVQQDKFKSEELTRTAVGLVGDMAHSLGEVAKSLLQQDKVGLLLEEASKGKSRTREIASWAKTQIRNL
eukprot:TRINITY_DN4134_c0_g1_i1.p1 TRINITY_DN4134_c0_g1~~TRINITY_DN4134_c0_g1_i1.p1  ORF type:complete len:855 (-),score=179.15 TRINITY_DN4134_c0_g1_i1:113-2677(-)